MEDAKIYRKKAYALRVGFFFCPAIFTSLLVEVIFMKPFGLMTDWECMREIALLESILSDNNITEEQRDVAQAYLKRDKKWLEYLTTT